MPSRIDDYALLSDMESAALVAKDGSIDWLTFPRFDSGACFAALLGTPEHGRWLLAPTGEPRSVGRRYRGDSLVLETVFTVDGGEVAVIDCMPPRDRQLDVVRLWRAGEAWCGCERSWSSASTTDGRCRGCTGWTAPSRRSPAPTPSGS